MSAEFLKCHLRTCGFQGTNSVDFFIQIPVEIAIHKMW